MCYKCDLLDESFRRTPQTNRDYWVMTELFVLLHDGNDYCTSEFTNKEEEQLRRDFLEPLTLPPKQRCGG